MTAALPPAPAGGGDRTAAEGLRRHVGGVGRAGGRDGVAGVGAAAIRVSRGAP